MSEQTLFFQGNPPGFGEGGPRMKAWEIIAWTFDGAIYCADHGPQSAAPVFASEINDVAGDVCDNCHERLVD